MSQSVTDEGARTEKGSRRAELLAIAADLFANRGFKNTTVRDIADAAGILSGSLYHHFDSKETMIDEILTTFQEELLDRYEVIKASDLDARAKFEAIIRISFETIRDHRSEVAIYQNETAHLGVHGRYSYLNPKIARMRELWIGLLEEGVATGVFRPGIDTEVIYRFVRDTVWVAVKWYRPDGGLTAEELAGQYLSILFDGIAIQHEPV
ncbi:MAG: TetR/AcrR family transcriptional regulator [Actinomycetota bacterium]